MMTDETTQRGQPCRHWGYPLEKFDMHAHKRGLLSKLKERGQEQRGLDAAARRSRSQTSHTRDGDSEIL